MMDNLKIENARLIFRNFSGKESKFNPAGNRNFCIVIDDPKMANTLKSDGWNIKQRVSQDDPDDVLNYLPVKVKYGYIPPKIMTIAGKKKTILEEDDLNGLDYAELANVDVIVRPYEWDINGRVGVTAYVKSLYATLVVDDFAAKYEDDSEEELPF